MGVELEEHPLVGRRAREAHRVVDARATPGALRRPGDRQRDHVRQVRHHGRRGRAAGHPRPDRQVIRGRRRTPRGAAPTASRCCASWRRCRPAAPAGSGTGRAPPPRGWGRWGSARRPPRSPPACGARWRRGRRRPPGPRPGPSPAPVRRGGPRPAPRWCTRTDPRSWVSPAMNCTVVHRAGRAVSTSASATATAMAVPPNSLPSKRASGRVSSKRACPGPSATSPSSSWSEALDRPSMVRSVQAAVMADDGTGARPSAARNPPRLCHTPRAH